MLNTGRILTLLLAITGGLLLWTAVRYAHRGSSDTGSMAAFAGSSGSTDSRASTGSSGKATLRFFRNPVEIEGFTAIDLDGRPVSPVRGKVTIINFWATWCSPCRAEVPDLVALQEKYRDRLQIIGVSEDEAPAGEVRQFVVAHKMNYPV
ncbi:MAG TPA: TlpA disulfide reductase family protein, partial [Vicinamibacterales bacterium]|nr:TlpA disulfide reductase family protein [Vicinamibacterales bacterium]